MPELIFERGIELPSKWSLSMMNLYVGLFEGFSFGMSLKKKITDRSYWMEFLFISSEG